MQNTDAKDVSNPFNITIVRSLGGNKISLMNQIAMRNPVQRKDVLELFQSFGNKPMYTFELMVTTTVPAHSYSGEYRGFYSDLLGRSVVYCSYHVTFGN